MENNKVGYSQEALLDKVEDLLRRVDMAADLGNKDCRQMQETVKEYHVKNNLSEPLEDASVDEKLKHELMHLDVAFKATNGSGRKCLLDIAIWKVDRLAEIADSCNNGDCAIEYK